MKNFSTEVRERIDQLQLFARDGGKQSILFIEFCPTAEDRAPRALMNRETALSLLGFCEVGTLAEMRDVLDYAEGRVDVVALDTDQKVPEIAEAYGVARGMLRQTELFGYSDHDAWGQALCSLVCQLREPVAAVAVLLVGGGNLTFKLALALAERGYDVKVHAPSDAHLNDTLATLNRIKHRYGTHEVSALASASGGRDFDFIIGTAVKSAVVDVGFLARLKSGGILVDGGIGSVPQDTVRTALEQRVPVYRLDNRAAISAVLVNLLETKDLVKNRMGRETIAGVPLVAGGMLGRAGDVIVDSISNPTLVIGVADGAGRVVDNPRDAEETARVEKIKNLISFRC